MSEPLSIRVSWDGQSFLNVLRTDMEKNLDKAGLYLVSSWRQYANNPQPYKRYAGKKAVYYKGLNPSAPGQFPHKLTGQFQRSLTYKVDKKALTLEVGSSLAGYPMFLQFGTKWMQPRPWLTIAWERDKDHVGKILLGG